MRWLRASLSSIKYVVAKILTEKKKQPKPKGPNYPIWVIYPYVFTPMLKTNGPKHHFLNTLLARHDHTECQSQGQCKRDTDCSL